MHFLLAASAFQSHFKDEKTQMIKEGEKGWTGSERKRKWQSEDWRRGLGRSMVTLENWGNDISHLMKQAVQLRYYLVIPPNDRICADI